MPDQRLGEIELVDGSRRPVFEEPGGRQYVVDDNGERVYGVWIIPPDAEEPIVA